jgi:hypothetical protein
MTPLFLGALLALSPAAATAGSPVAKVLEMISDLQTKIIGEGENTQKVYEEFSEWCEEQSKNLHFEIKTATAEVADLKAVIAEETAIIASLTSKVEDLSGETATAEADLKAATDIRGKEAADFAAEEKEGMEIIDTLERAIHIVSGASFIQSKSTTSITQALKVMVQANVFSSADSERLTALVQSDSDDDQEPGAPDSAVYEAHTGGIVETLEGLLEKAKDQLEAARKKEQSSLYNFDLLKQSLTDQIKTASANLDKAKKGIAASSEKKATAEGDLTVTSKDLAAATSTLAHTHHDCETKAADFEAETTSRAEELKALADAKKIVAEATGAASLQQVSFLQVARSGLSQTAPTNFQAVRFVRKLAKKLHAPALAQLASRMASAIRYESRTNAADPFAKVKGLISDLIAKLEEESRRTRPTRRIATKKWPRRRSRMRTRARRSRS